MIKFDPYQQSILFFTADGMTRIDVPMPMVDDLNRETVSICINYGVQLGACLIMLAMVLIMTPSSKFRRPSTLLHILGLLICAIRMTLLSVYFTSHFNDFYAFWAHDFSRVPAQDFRISIASTTFSLLLLIVVEAALMNQAWTMVTLWPPVAKISLCVLSVAISVLSIGWRIAFTIIQSKAVLSLEPSTNFHWLNQWTVITNALSICWFCALFNMKLMIHLVVNRGILPTYTMLTPMEVLVMTNGVLMTVPVLFAGLEWGNFPNFESASLTLTSVAVMLPLGTLAAQRMARSNNFAYNSDSFNGQMALLPNTVSSSTPLKLGSFSNGCHNGTVPQASLLSKCEAGIMSTRGPGNLDFELSYFESQQPIAHGQVRVDRELEQSVHRLQ